MTGAALTDHLAPAQVASIAHADARVSVWHGSIRSGKTIASLLAWLIWVAHAPRGGALVVIGRTRESIARNVFTPLQDSVLFGMVARHVHYTPGAPTAMVLGRLVHVLGASDARAEMVLRGLTVAGAYVDEATLVSEAFWTQLLGRMSVPGARLFATTNPDGPAHWFRRQVIQRADELGYRVFRFTIDDNPFLPPEYVAQIKREYVGLWYRRFILGEWVQAEGAIYDTWDPARHVADPATFPPMDRVLGVGVDYGDTHHTRGYLLGLGPDTRDGHTGEHRLYVLAEWAPGAATQGEQSARFQAWLVGQPVEAWRTPEWVAVDSAAASFRNQLSHDGVRGVRNAHKAVLPGIRNVAALLATTRLVVASTCTQLIEKLPGYVWDPKATARGEDAPIKADDDECLALGTSVLTVDGWRPVESIRPGDRVVTRAGLRPVEVSAATHGGRAVETVRLDLSNGASLVVTGNHPMFLHDGSVRRADALAQDDMLYGWSNSSCNTASSSGATPDATTSHPTTPTGHEASKTFTAKSGSVSAETSRQAGTSTTATATPATTTSITSNACRPTGITIDTAQIARHSDALPSSSIASPRSESSPPVGTAALKVSLGTPSTAVVPGSIESRNASPASSAEPSSSSTQQPGSARTPASPPGGEPMASTTRNAAASSAAHSSRSTGTPRPAPVPVRVLRVCAGPRVATWNLAVADQHEYVAAGVLVHNCDALRYAVYTTRLDWRDLVPLAAAADTAPGDDTE